MSFNCYVLLIILCDLSTFAVCSLKQFRYHAFKLEVLKDSHCETAQFWARYMDMIQMMLTLIRATRKATLNCMSSLSVCLVPNVHCKRSQQLRTICTCVTDYTYKFDTHRRCKEFLEQNGFSVSQPLFLCLRNAFEITTRQTIKRYYRLQQLEIRFARQME